MGLSKVLLLMQKKQSRIQSPRVFGQRVSSQIYPGIMGAVSQKTWVPVSVRKLEIGKQINDCITMAGRNDGLNELGKD